MATLTLVVLAFMLCLFIPSTYGSDDLDLMDAIVLRSRCLVKCLTLLGQGGDGVSVSYTTSCDIILRNTSSTKNQDYIIKYKLLLLYNQWIRNNLNRL